MDSGEQSITSLVTSLTAACPGWAIWKKVDAAVRGVGDVDSVAPTDEWPTVTDVFTRWARDARLGPVVVCRHVPGALFLVACDPASERLVELDVYSHLVLRGMAYLDTDELAPLTQIDPLGFRRLRPGAEGLFLLLGTMMASSGKLRSGPEERVRSLLACDVEGMELAAALFGRSSTATLRCAEAVLGGRWNRLAAARWELGALLRIRRMPGLAVARVWFGLRHGARCAVLDALATGRRMPSPAAPWLEAVRRTHTVL
jgi:hypothetical protein